MPAVLVSGATGFIALHIIDALLTKGYKVIGTVRAEARGASIAKGFKAKHPNGEFVHEVVADMSVEGAFDEVTKKYAGELEYVIHTATPTAFGLPGTKIEAYVTPAINGTLGILKSVKSYAPKVKNIVITSSLVACLNFQEKDYVHTEESWSPVTLEMAESDIMAAYGASKKFAEQAAWKFAKEELPNVGLTTVLPGFVIGPQLFEDALKASSLNFSCEGVAKLLKTSPEQDPMDLSFSSAYVDVRDIADIHVLSLEKDVLAGQRLLALADKSSEQRNMNIIHENFPELDGKIAKGSPEKADSYVQNVIKYDCSKTEKLTGITWRPVEKSVVDSIQQILDYKKIHA